MFINLEAHNLGLALSMWLFVKLVIVFWNKIDGSINLQHKLKLKLFLSWNYKKDPAYKLREQRLCMVRKDVIDKPCNFIL